MLIFGSIGIARQRGFRPQAVVRGGARQGSGDELELSVNGKIVIALTAGFGGVSPNLLKLAMGLTGGSKHVPEVNLGYLVGLLLYAAMGAAIALIWQERVPRRAFYLGIGLPSLLHVALSGAAAPGGLPRAGGPDPAQGAAFHLLTPPAYAQAPSPARTQAPSTSIRTCGGLTYDLGRKLDLVLDDVPRGTELIFISQDGKTLCEKSLPPNDEDGLASVAIPDFMAEFSLRAGTLQSTGFPLEPRLGDTIRYEVDIDSKFWGGFLRALGLETAEPYQFEIKLLPPGERPRR